MLTLTPSTPELLEWTWLKNTLRLITTVSIKLPQLNHHTTTINQLSTKLAVYKAGSLYTWDLDEEMDSRKRAIRSVVQLYREMRNMLGTYLSHLSVMAGAIQALSLYLPPIPATWYWIPRALAPTARRTPPIIATAAINRRWSDAHGREKARMIPLQVPLQWPCYDFYSLQAKQLTIVRAPEQQSA